MPNFVLVGVVVAVAVDGVFGVALVAVPPLGVTATATATTSHNDDDEVDDNEQREEVSPDFDAGRRSLGVDNGVDGCECESICSVPMLPSMAVDDSDDRDGVVVVVKQDAIVVIVAIVVDVLDVDVAFVAKLALGLAFFEGRN